MDPHHLAHPSGALRPKPGKTISKKPNALTIPKRYSQPIVWNRSTLTTQGSLLSIIGMDVHTTPRPTCSSSSAPACEDKA